MSKLRALTDEDVMRALLATQGTGTILPCEGRVTLVNLVKTTIGKRDREIADLETFSTEAAESAERWQQILYRCRIKSARLEAENIRLTERVVDAEHLAKVACKDRSEIQAEVGKLNKRIVDLEKETTAMEGLRLINETLSNNNARLRKVVEGLTRGCDMLVDEIDPHDAEEGGGK